MPSEVFHNLVGMCDRNNRISLQGYPSRGSSGCEGTEDLKNGAPVHLISPQLPHEHVHGLWQQAAY
jgi:hypothetical protein